MNRPARASVAAGNLRFDKHVAAFLPEESFIEKCTEWKVTHETIANCLGFHRKLITRMLWYVQSEEMVKLRRGSVMITDEAKLQQLQD